MRLTELTETIAAELGMKLSEVNTRGRFAREAGFLRSGPRGRGALDMEPADLAAYLLAMVSFVEPTQSAFGLRELQRSNFEFCEWFDREAVEASLFETDEERKPKKWRWSPAPLSPLFGNIFETKDPIWCLAKLVAAVGHRPDDVALLKIESKTDKDGLSVTLSYSEMATGEQMKDRFIQWSGDNSDGWYFPESDEIRRWTIDARFLLGESQMDQRSRTVAIEGVPLSRLIRRVSEAWEDHPDEN
ncbi:MAG: hypothetical protein AAF376_00060 [Pseudomonadota bacterium]